MLYYNDDVGDGMFKVANIVQWGRQLFSNLIERNGMGKWL